MGARPVSFGWDGIVTPGGVLARTITTLTDLAMPYPIIRVIDDELHLSCRKAAIPRLSFRIIAVAPRALAPGAAQEE